MEDQFVPYELALKLKELGYGQDGYDHCGYWNKPIGYSDYSLFLKNCSLPLCTRSTPITAPLWQQAFDWCITHHSLVGNVTWYGGLVYPNMCFNYTYGGSLTEGQIKTGRTCDKFQEARQECLEKLIKIISGKLNIQNKGN